MTPQRIQLQRTKGWRKPDDAIVVARPSRWGNPFRIDDDWVLCIAIGLGYGGDAAGRRAAAVALHAAWMTDRPVQPGPHAEEHHGREPEFSTGERVSFADHARSLVIGIGSLMRAPSLPERPGVRELQGHDLACWCALDEPCHADILLELANGSTE